MSTIEGSKESALLQTKSYPIAENIPSETSQKDYVWEVVQQCQKTGIGGGGAVRRFAQITGILTSDNNVDARLWNGYRKYSKSGGDSQEEYSNDDGEYP